MCKVHTKSTHEKPDRKKKSKPVRTFKSLSTVDLYSLDSLMRIVTRKVWPNVGGVTVVIVVIAES